MTTIEDGVRPVVTAVTAIGVSAPLVESWVNTDIV
jgi:hypothetical protein